MNEGTRSGKSTIRLLGISAERPTNGLYLYLYTQTIYRTTQYKQYIEQHKNFGRVRAMPFLGELYGKTSVRVAEQQGYIDNNKNT
jgi:hypothetical protein